MYIVHMSRLKDLEKFEMPRERSKSLGMGNLNDIELLSLILRSGGRNRSVIEVARELIHAHKSLENLAKAELGELQRIKDIGLAKAAAVKAAFEISQRLGIKQTASEQQVEVNGPTDVFNAVYKDFINKEKEELRVLCLNARHKLIEKSVVSVGSVNESIVHPREVFKCAIKNNAVSIVLAHNHPSGDTTPSIEDIQATKQIEEAGKILGINVIDHLIIYNEVFTSIKSWQKNVERG